MRRSNIGRIPALLLMVAVLLLNVVPVTLVARAADHATSLLTAAITVTNLNDSGEGSLREAINQANGDGTPSLITFSSAVSGGTIYPTSLLPGLSEDGTTIEGDVNHDNVPDIELSGRLLNTDETAISVWSSHNVIRGLAINGFGSDGINITGNYNLVEHCYIGTDLTGMQPRGNGGSGVRVGNGATGNQIGPENIIAYNAARVGPNAGVAVLDGLVLAYPQFAGLTPDYVGVFPVLDFPATRGAFTSIDGITPLDGLGQPFADTFGARFTGLLGLPLDGDYTFAVSADDLARVVVDGTEIIEAGCMSPTGCTDQQKTTTLTAGSHTIEVDFLDGPGSAHLNVSITGAGLAELTSGGQTGLLGQFFQLRVPSERNRITRNSIFANYQLGIDLDALEDWFGVNPNDPGDGDVGPNTALNSPVFTLAVAAPGQLVLQGKIDTPHPDTITIEFFGNPVPVPGGDPSGHGEGAIYLGMATPNKNGSFVATLPPVPVGTLISATATDAVGNTSEFAANIRASLPPK